MDHTLNLTTSLWKIICLISRIVWWTKPCILINKRLRNLIENITANIAESEQYYLSKKLRYLNQALQESNVVKNDHTLIKRYFFNEENFFKDKRSAFEYPNRDYKANGNNFCRSNI